MITQKFPFCYHRASREEKYSLIYINRMEEAHMTMPREYGGIDRFRLIAALLIVGIHTYPLSDLSEGLNFGFVHVFARIAVPFFLMVTGYFVCCNTKSLFKFIKKAGLLYAGATLLYLPVSIYAGYYSNGNILSTAAKNIVFDGTFYHLWYLPASIVGVALFHALSRKFSLNAVLGLAIVLYVIGLLGDSYYGFISGMPHLRAAYDMGFRIFSYTRNGLFYAPVFLAMGAVMAKTGGQMRKWKSITGFFVSLALMLLEGFVLRSFDYPRHDSMYIVLIPCMFFLFQFLLSLKGKASPILRDISLWIYVLHPIVIVGFRGMVKFMGLTGLLVENSVIHYLAVCLLSSAFAVIIAKLQIAFRPASFHKSRAWL